MYVKCLKKREIKIIHLKKVSLHVLHMISVVTPHTELYERFTQQTYRLPRESSNKNTPQSYMYKCENEIWLKGLYTFATFTSPLHFCSCGKYNWHLSLPNHIWLTVPLLLPWILKESQPITYMKGTTNLAKFNGAN